MRRQGQPALRRLALFAIISRIIPGPSKCCALSTVLNWDCQMLTKGQTASSVRAIETNEDFEEARLEAVGYIFHGRLPAADGKKAAAKTSSNLLHFARCAKLEKATETESKIWFRTLSVAKKHLDEVVGENRWRWCKTCEREVTQRLINEQ